MHRHLIDDLRTLIAHVGDTSFLILDPVLDSYYLIDTTLQALPQTQDHLAALIAYGEDLSSDTRAELGDQQKIRFAVWRSQLKESDEDRIAADIETSLNEDLAFPGSRETLRRNIPPALIDYQRNNAELISISGPAGGDRGCQLSALHDPVCLQNESFQLPVLANWRGRGGTVFLTIEYNTIWTCERWDWQLPLLLSFSHYVRRFTSFQI